jgi:hypothetical protein
MADCRAALDNRPPISVASGLTVMENQRVVGTFVRVASARAFQEFAMTEEEVRANLTDAVATASDLSEWRDAVGALGDEVGYLQILGPRHRALFIDNEPTLIVSFVTEAQARARADQMPQAAAIATAKGWSSLTIVADGDTWWRDPAVWAFFDRLVDDAFFEDFDRVLFYGERAGAYAACAYAVAAPGASVLALAPRATLDPARAGWDTRFRAARRLDFTRRYGFAPDMTEGAARVFVVYDPDQTFDAMHAALFGGRWVTPLRARLIGQDPAAALDQMQILSRMIEAAAEGRLSAEGWGKLWRARRNFGPYLKAILHRAEAAGKPAREAAICRSVTRRLRAPRFRKRLAELTGE